MSEETKFAFQNRPITADYQTFSHIYLSLSVLLLLSIGFANIYLHLVLSTVCFLASLFYWNKSRRNVYDESSIASLLQTSGYTRQFEAGVKTGFQHSKPLIAVMFGNQTFKTENSDTYWFDEVNTSHPSFRVFEFSFKDRNLINNNFMVVEDVIYHKSPRFYFYRQPTPS